MWSSIRVLTCSLLVRHVAGLGTNVMQSNSMAMDAEFGRFEETFARPQDTVKKSDADTFLSNLRGLDYAFPPTVQLQESKARSHASANHAAVITLSKHQISETRILAALFLLVIIGATAFIVFSPSDEEEAFSGPARALDDLTALAASDGTWAQTYQNADETSKQGLELLFRCKIIPTDEFAHSKVNQEHIGECVWIATHMLRQKKLEDWLENWPEAQRTFEESVTACFAARTDVRSNFYDGILDNQTDDPSTHPFAMQADPPPGSGKSEQSASKMKMGADSGAGPKRELPPILKTPADRKSLMERCRQIMANSDAQRKPWDTKKESHGYGASSSSQPKPATNMAFQTDKGA